MNQEVEVGELAQGQIVVTGLREQRSFVRKCGNVVRVEAFQDAQQFLSEANVLLQVVAIFGGNGESDRVRDVAVADVMCNVGENVDGAADERHDVVMLGEFEDASPVEVGGSGRSDGLGAACLEEEAHLGRDATKDIAGHGMQVRRNAEHYRVEFRD